MNDDQLRAAFLTGIFRKKLEGEWKPWRDGFAAYVLKVRNTTEAKWMEPSCQKELWDSEAIAKIGPGRAVTVAGAYVDANLAASLLSARDTILPTNLNERAAAQQLLFDTVLEKVRPYSHKRPLARVVRLINALRPSDMCCLMDERRLWQVSGLLKLPQSKDGFIAQHAFLRARLRDALGPACSATIWMEARVNQYDAMTARRCDDGWWLLSLSSVLVSRRDNQDGWSVPGSFGLPGRRAAADLRL